jgi:hypothetical protein
MSLLRDHSSSSIIYKAEEMNGSTILRLEDLPIEILIEIFQYFWAHELYCSFSHLNIRLNSILKSLPNLILIVASHWDRPFSFFHSVHTIQIHFNNLTPSYLSQYDFSHCTGIRSFLICSMMSSNSYLEPIEHIDRFICPDLCSQLGSLWLPYCSQKLADWIFSGAFPRLKICHFSDAMNSTLVLPSSTNHSMPVLHHLTIQRQTGDDFEKILLLCPNLKYFDYYCNSTLPPFIHCNSPYLSLKRLRLSEIESFVFHNGQFDSLLSFFPSLTYLALAVYQCRLHNEAIDFARIAQNLRHRVPCLKLLELRIHTTIRNRSSFFRHSFMQISQMHPLFICFGRSNSSLHIASFDFTSTHHYHRSFIRSTYNESSSTMNQQVQ